MTWRAARNATAVSVTRATRGSAATSAAATGATVLALRAASLPGMSAATSPPAPRSSRIRSSTGGVPSSRASTSAYGDRRGARVVALDRMHAGRRDAARTEHALARDVGGAPRVPVGQAALVREEHRQPLPGNLAPTGQGQHDRAAAATARQRDRRTTRGRCGDEHLGGRRGHGLVHLGVRLVHLQLHGRAP